MDEKQLDQHMEKGIRAFFARLAAGKLFEGADGGGQDGDNKPKDKPAPKIRVAKALHEGLTHVAEALKADLTAESPAQVRAAAEAVDALLATAEVAAATTPETPAADEALTARVAALEAENTTLKAGLDTALASRKSQETVEGEKPFKSRYGGAFIR